MGNPTRGPVGAGGTRPLLGNRANAQGTGGATTAREEERPPSFRVPGASVAARVATNGNGVAWNRIAARPAQPNGGAATDAGRGGTGAAGKGKGASQAGDHDANSDGEEPWEVVRRKGRRGAAGSTDEAITTNQGRQRTDAGPEGRAAQAGEGGADRADAEGDGGEGADDPPTAEDLQQAWQKEVALVKRLRSQGLSDDHPAMRAACDNRDAAEQAWRSVKEPAPVAIRLGRAQGKLDRAITLQAEARSAMLEEQRRHGERMAELQATLDECTDKVRLRRRQVQEVQDELGARGNADGANRRAQMEAIKKVHSTICGDIGPTIAALVDQVDTGAPAWSALNGLLGKLQESKAALESVSADPQADCYDIGDQDDRCDSWSNWSESHDMQGQPWGGGNAGCGDGHDTNGDATMAQADDDEGQETNHGGYGSYDNWGCVPSGQGAQAQGMGENGWWGANSHRWGNSIRWQAAGHGKWARATWADQLEEEEGGEGDEADQPPPARRRLEANDDEHRTAGDAAKQQQQQRTTPTTGASAGTAGAAAGSDATDSDRKHAARVNQIVTMAIEAGVTPLTSKGEELCLLDAQQLEAWVAECLPAALLC